MCTAKSSLCSPLGSSARLLQNAAERQRRSRSGRPQPRRSPGEIGPLLVQADSVAAEETTDCRQVIEVGRVSNVCVLRSCSFISFSLGVIKPRIQSEFHNLGVDDVVVGVPNRSWPHFNHRRPFRSSSCLFRTYVSGSLVAASGCESASDGAGASSTIFNYFESCSLHLRFCITQLKGRLQPSTVDQSVHMA